MGDVIIAVVIVAIALLVGGAIAFGRGRNRCAVRPRIKD